MLRYKSCSDVWSAAARSLVMTAAFTAFVGAFFLNYAASVGFFFLALVGLCVGLRNGFRRYVGRREVLVAILLAGPFVVAVISYALGDQTDVGFRMLGRELRFVLFLPILVALIWTGLRSAYVVYAVCLGAAGTLLYGVCQSVGGFTATGVASTHIVYGDGALLLGATGAMLSLSSRGLSRGASFVAAALCFGCGLAASILSGARGGWIAMPILALLMVFKVEGWRARVGTGVIVMALFAAIAAVPKLREVAARRTAAAWQHYLAYEIGAANWSLRCPNNRVALTAMLRAGALQGRGVSARVVGSDLAGVGAKWQQTCGGGYALQVRNTSRDSAPALLALYRGGDHSGRQQLAVLLKGRGSVRAGWTGKLSPVKSTVFHRVAVEAVGPPGIPLQLIVHAGQSLSVIPLQTYSGEYTDPLTRSPVGNRLMMWHAALRLAREHPIIGYGFGSFRDAVSRMVSHNRISPSTLGYEHPHNMYLNWIYGAGAFGGIALLLMLLGPVFAMRSTVGQAAAVAFASGVTLAGLTESLFVHSLWITWYVLAIGILVSLTHHSKSRMEK